MRAMMAMGIVPSAIDGQDQVPQRITQHLPVAGHERIESIHIGQETCTTVLEKPSTFSSPQVVNNEGIVSRGAQAAAGGQLKRRVLQGHAKEGGQ